MTSARLTFGGDAEASVREGVVQKHVSGELWTNDSRHSYTSLFARASPDLRNITIMTIVSSTAQMQEVDRFRDMARLSQAEAAVGSV